MIRINQKAVEFTGDAYINGEIKKINLNDYKGKWLILFFRIDVQCLVLFLL